MENKINKFNEFSNEDLMSDLDKIEGEFVSVKPEDLIFGIYYSKSRIGEEKIAAYITPKKDFEKAIGSGGSESGGFGYPTYTLSSYMQNIGTIGLEISGLEEIQEGIYIPEGSSFNETNSGLNLKDFVKTIAGSGIRSNRIFQNVVSQEAKNHQTWTFHSAYEICEILDQVGFDYSKDDKFYFDLDMDRSVEEEWDDDEAGFDLAVSLDPDDFDTSDPDWELIKDDISSLRLYPDYDGFSSECSVIFNKEDQPKNIREMEWQDLKKMIISGLESKGWVYLNH